MKGLDSLLDKSGVYLIRCLTTNRVYVGSSLNVRVRCYSHLYDLIHGSHANKYLQSAWKKYSQEAFTCEVVEYCDAAVRLVKEGEFIQQCRLSDAGVYNQCLIPTGGREGVSHTEETKRKISEAQRGRQVPDARKAKIAATLRGRKFGPRSEQARRNMSLAPRNKNRKPFTQEYRAKISAARLGVKRKPFSEQARRNMSLAHSGKKRGPYSEEHKAKISAGVLRSKERRRIKLESHKL